MIARPSINKDIKNRKQREAQGIFAREKMFARGAYFSIYHTPGAKGGGQKYEVTVGWGKKYHDLLIKIGKLRWKRWENGNIFTVPEGKNIFFLRGWTNIHKFGQI